LPFGECPNNLVPGRERAESCKAPEALQKRVWGIEEEKRPEGLWRMLGQKLSVLKEKWRAEVGPRMRGVPPATDSSPIGQEPLI